MRNQHWLKIFRDFWKKNRTLLGSFGTYPGVQNRSLGATFPTIWKFPKWSRKWLGRSRRLPGGPRTPLTNINLSGNLTFFLTFFFKCLLNCLLNCLFNCLLYCLLYCLFYCLLHCLLDCLLYCLLIAPFLRSPAEGHGVALLPICAPKGALQASRALHGGCAWNSNC